MSIHPRGGTTSLQFFSNLEDKFVTMRQVKIQNFRLVPSPGAKRRPRAEGPRARVLISTGI